MNIVNHRVVSKRAILLLLLLLNKKYFILSTQDIRSSQFLYSFNPLTANDELSRHENIDLFIDLDA